MTDSDKPAIEKRMSAEGGFFYWDTLHERTYAKIVGAFTWPAAKPGYGLIVAADRFEDPAFNARHMWTLGEREEIDLTDLFKWMLRASGHWQVEHWLGDLSSFALSDLLDRFNRDQREKKLPEIRAWTPSHLDDNERFAAGMATARTFTAPGNKLLHLGVCEVLKSQLRAFPADQIHKEKDWPPLLALSYTLDTVRDVPRYVPQERKQTHAVTAYNPFGER